MTSYLYITINHLNGKAFHLKVLDNGPNAYKASALEAGRPATFDIPKDHPLYTKPVGSDKVTEQTITLYPHSFESMVIKTIESESP